ncbi:8-oxo-dGTP diphosphatase MutT [Acidocella sp.]|uniref:8-oxo-dGTP diphosphatase MutT n=1 Tax=Acidocella sp. TaxID=50710 RepID=UPI0026105ECA|nr:8-oxo-dGTP diphosphatase MutT [Acidocella sp.]MDD2795573.1 8-oxo-dGTP diphosphatase MutT [Acidocella sp.]
MPDLLDSLMPDTQALAGPLLRTSRLTLRPLAAEDVAVFHRLINDWEICRRLPDAPFPYPADLAAAWIAAAAADRLAGRAEQFALVDEATGEMIGCAGLRMGKGHKAADLGYWLGRAFWGQGYGLEAARRLVEWAFAAFAIMRLTATVAADNDASAALLQRVGFLPSGKGGQVFMCRPGQKLPVKHFALEREAPAAAVPKKNAVLLVVAVALIDAQGRILLARRPEGKKMAGMWEFPGGKVEAGETPEAALVRELREELGIEAAASDLAPFVFASHPYENFHLLMPVFLCRRWNGTPHPREGQALAWVAPERLVEYPMPPADRPLIPMLRDFL